MGFPHPSTLSHELGALAVSQGFFPLHDGRQQPPCVSRIVLVGIRSLVGFGKAVSPPSPSSALPPTVFVRGATYIAFAENQLFPSLISLSPLATTHPRHFQQTPVRPSSRCYPAFSLVMARSLGFGSNPTNSTPYSGSLSLRLHLSA